MSPGPPPKCEACGNDCQDYRYYINDKVYCFACKDSITVIKHNPPGTNLKNRRKRLRKKRS